MVENQTKNETEMVEKQGNQAEAVTGRPLQGQDVIADVPQMEVEAPSQDSNQQTTEPVTQEAASEPKSSPIIEPKGSDATAKHFKALKEKTERAERERDELMRMLTEERNKQTPKPAEPEEDFGVNSDDFVEGKHLKKYAQEVRELKKELAQYKQKTAIDVTETKLRTEFPDFDKVFSNDNIERLKEEHPEIAQTLGASSADPYLVAKSTYKMIKKLGVHIEDNYEPDRELVQKNLSKPRPLASVSPRQGDSVLSKANAFGGELTDELKAQLWKEVQEATR